MKNKLFMALQLFADDSAPADPKPSDPGDPKPADPKPGKDDPEPGPDPKSVPKYTEFMQMPQGVRGINVIGTGIDVEILQRCRSSKLLKGKFQYIISLIISLFKFRNYAMLVKVNGKESRYNALIACVGNGYRIGGGIPMCPEAKLGDNLLDFVAVDDVKKLRIPPAFIKLMKGKILEQNFTAFERCEHVEILPEKPLMLQVDGELYENLPFVVDIVKDTLRMFRA